MLRRWSPGLRAATLVGVVGVIAVLFRATAVGDRLDGLARDLAEHPGVPWSYLAFVGVYASCVAVGVPGSLFTLSGGALFGMWPGMALNLVGGGGGAALAYLLSRSLGREFVLARLGRFDVAGLQAKLESPRTTFAMTARLRLVPLLPFSVVNFAAGVVRAPLVPFLAGSVLGVVPSTAAWTYYGGGLRDGSGPPAVAALHLGAGMLALLALSFVPTAAPALVRRWRARRG